MKRLWRFLRKSIRKILLAIVLLFFLSGVLSAVLIFAKQGDSITAGVDGKIDTEYYHTLVLDNKKINDISEISDVLAEVYYLTHGEDIRQFRFTFYEAEHKPLRVLFMENMGRAINLFGENYRFYGIGGMNWGNGDIYISGKESRNLLSLMDMTFHELGHGINRSYIEQIGGAFEWVKAKCTGDLGNIEAEAERNVLDSAVALMYLDPDLGFAFLCTNGYGRLNHDHLFSDFSGEYAKARNFSLYRALLGIQEEEYVSDESLEAEIKENISGMTNNEIIRQIHRGVLEMFRAKFGKMPDFPEKYSLLEQHMEYGLTDNSYEKAFISTPETMEKIRLKETFLEQEHSALIRENLMRSLLSDYRKFDEAKAFSLFCRMIADKTTEEWAENISYSSMISISDLEWALKYAYREGDKERAAEFFALLKKSNEKDPREWITKQIAAYEPYFSN